MPTSVSYSPNGQLIVVGTEFGGMFLWDIRNLPPVIRRMKGDVEWVTGVDFSPDGRYIVSGDLAGTIRLWDPSTTQSISVPIQGHQTSITSIAYSPDGLRIVSGGADTTLRLWPAPAVFPNELCAKLTRNMSRKHWREYVGTEIEYTCQCPGLPIAPDEPESAAKPDICLGKPAESIYAHWGNEPIR